MNYFKRMWKTDDKNYFEIMWKIDMIIPSMTILR